jgi:hypothetical protein
LALRVSVPSNGRFRFHVSSCCWPTLAGGNRRRQRRGGLTGDRSTFLNWASAAVTTQLFRQHKPTDASESLLSVILLGPVWPVSNHPTEADPSPPQCINPNAGFRNYLNRGLVQPRQICNARIWDLSMLERAYGDGRRFEPVGPNTIMVLDTP